MLSRPLSTKVIARHSNLHRPLTVVIVLSNLIEMCMRNLVPCSYTDKNGAGILSAITVRVVESLYWSVKNHIIHDLPRLESDLTARRIYGIIWQARARSPRKLGSLLFVVSFDWIILWNSWLFIEYHSHLTITSSCLFNFNNKCYLKIQ